MLFLSKNEHDFGTLQKGSTGHFQVSVRNEYPFPVTPTLSASCGCTIPTLDPATIPANGTAQLLVDFDTTGKQGFQRKNVYVGFKNNNAPINLTCTFTANVEN
mgnify:CR=1 FL=1